MLDLQCVYVSDIALRATVGGADTEIPQLFVRCQGEISSLLHSASRRAAQISSMMCQSLTPRLTYTVFVYPLDIRTLYYAQNTAITKPLLFSLYLTFS